MQNDTGARDACDEGPLLPSCKPQDLREMAFDHFDHLLATHVPGDQDEGAYAGAYPVYRNEVNGGRLRIWTSL